VTKFVMSVTVHGQRSCDMSEISATDDVGLPLASVPLAVGEFQS